MTDVVLTMFVASYKCGCQNTYRYTSQRAMMTWMTDMTLGRREREVRGGEAFVLS